MFIKIDKFMLFCIKVKPIHKEAESFSLMILLLLYPYYIRNCSEPTSKMLRILYLFFEILLGSEQLQIFILRRGGRTGTIHKSVLH